MKLLRNRKSAIHFSIFGLGVLVVLAISLRFLGFYVPIPGSGTKAEYYVRKISWYSDYDFLDEDRARYHRDQLSKCDCGDVAIAVLDYLLEVGCRPRKSIPPISLLHTCESVKANEVLSRRFKNASTAHEKMSCGLAVFSVTGDIEVLSSLLTIPPDDLNTFQMDRIFQCLWAHVEHRYPEAPTPIVHSSNEKIGFADEFRLWVERQTAK